MENKTLILDMPHTPRYFYATKDKYGFPVPGTMMSYDKPLDLTKVKNKMQIFSSYAAPGPCQQEVCHPSGMRFFAMLDDNGNILPTRLFSQLQPPKTGKYVEIKKIIGPVCYAVQTFTNQDTPGYPMGVFNVNGGFVGFANNATDYVTLWNSDPANSAVDTISNPSGSATSVFFATVSGTNPGLRGCRYWQVDVRGWAHLATGSYDRILVETGSPTPTLYVANAYTNTYPYTSPSLNRYWFNHSQYGLNANVANVLPAAPGPSGDSSAPWFINPRNYDANPQWEEATATLSANNDPTVLNLPRQTNINIGSTQRTVTVFHQENSQAAGFISNIVNSAAGVGVRISNWPPNVLASSEMMNLRGTWPPGCMSIVLHVNGTIRENIYPSNITNYNELTKVVAVEMGMSDQVATTYAPVGPWAAGNYSLLHDFLQALPNKQLLLSVSTSTFRNTENSSLDGSGISTGDFPNLKNIVFITKSKPFTPNAATFPKIDSWFNIMYGNIYGSEAWTGAQIDAIYNMLGTRLVGILPKGKRRLDVQWFNTAATAASLTARTYLAGQGWTVN